LRGALLLYQIVFRLSSGFFKVFSKKCEKREKGVGRWAKYPNGGKKTGENATFCPVFSAVFGDIRQFTKRKL
jgi:hypothetical protein